MTALRKPSADNPPIGLYTPFVACPLCNSATEKVIHQEQNALPKDDSRFDAYRDEPVFLKECQNCFFAFVDKLPSDQNYFDAIYTNLKPNWHNEFFHHGKKKIDQDIKKMILKYQPTGRLLDIGCWAGAFLHTMSDRFQVQGIELNPDGAAFARNHGLKIENSMIDQVTLENNSFEVVTLIDVLEHLPHPGVILKKITHALKKSGVIYIKVPSYPGQLRKQNLLRGLGLSNEGIMQNYVHINHFSRASLATELKSLGYEILDSGFTRAETWDLTMPSSLARKTKWIARNIVVTAVTSILSHLTRLTGAELGLNLYIIARKN